MNIPEILGKKYPGTEWLQSGANYSGLTWLSDSPKPSKKTLEGLWAEVQAEIVAEEQAREERKQSVISKLGVLGLTPDEVADVFGLEVQS